MQRKKRTLKIKNYERINDQLKKPFPQRFNEALQEQINNADEETREIIKKIKTAQ